MLIICQLSVTKQHHMQQFITELTATYVPQIDYQGRMQGGFLGFQKPQKFCLAIGTTINHHSWIYKISDYLVLGSTNTCSMIRYRVAKLLAIGNLHFYSIKSMLRKISKYSNRAVNCSLKYSNRTFIASLGNPFVDTPLDYPSTFNIQTIFNRSSSNCSLMDSIPSSDTNFFFN